MVHINNRGIPVVAKLDEKDIVLEEIKRFQHFVQGWDNQLRPKLYMHSKFGLILFGLVPESSNQLQPAPTLEERLKYLWWGELYTNVEQPPNPIDLTLALENAAEKLCQLNKRTVSNQLFSCFSKPNMRCFWNLEARDIYMGFNKKIINARQMAEDQFKKLDELAIVHGDVQLRNILVRGDRESFLIDYACSGPGHPAVDLVRLELSLYLSAVQQTLDEDTLCLFQNKFSIENASYDSLSSEFPEMFKLSINCVCIKGCIAARDKVMEVIESHGGDKKDYLATKYLVAWQCLIIDELQKGLARGIIKTLSDEISGWYR